MAMELNDLMALKSLENNDRMTPYEQFKVGHIQSKRASGTAIGALAVGVGAAVLAIGAGAWAGSQASKAKEVAAAKNDGLRDLVQTLAGTLAAERNERIQGDYSITQTVTDTVSGSQSGQLSALQQAELAASQATQQVMQQTFADAVTGRSSLNATPVQIFSAPQPCGCPGCGCQG